MAYALEHQNESTRLSMQTEISAYSIRDELDLLSLGGVNTVLDAGCGNGIVSRYLSDRKQSLQITAVDGSEIRIQQAKNASKGYSNINYINMDLVKIDVRSQFDLIICRYVCEYFKNPIEVLKKFKSLLSPSGKLKLIDFDGIFFDLETRDQEFNQTLYSLRDQLGVDCYVGRRLKHYLREAGFTDLECKVTSHHFEGLDLVKEVENNQYRFEAIWDVLVEQLRSEEKASKFIKDYTYYMQEPHSTLCYTKYNYCAR